MKTTFALVGALAAVANANIYHRDGHMFFPRNGTTVHSTGAADAITTLTVKATQTHTVTSCKPTVTNCPVGKPGMSSVPESDRVTHIATHTVVLTTTECPVSEAHKISSSVVSDHSEGKITGSTVTEVIPATTPAQVPAGYTTSVASIVTDKTLTMTLGDQGSQSVVKTVIHSTIKSTVTVPCDKAEPTTTTTATRTSTRTVTISKAKTSAVPKPSGDESCHGPAPTVTVTVTPATVTVPASTVYVTVPCGANQTPASNPPAVSQKADNGNTGNDNKQPEAQKTSDCPPDVTTTMAKVVTVVPYPKNNGTSPESGKAKPTGSTPIRH
ncbi:hypothetical protein VHEMI00146 [[Torrubiella] hemipterigena]|uniref:Uncharacterized protein n=1 Tax=[Torrubiella] hemipterigena TaxID=1531966 RepID=A0A0A1T1D8_9HYPO|nr:hypothetical protein VHEMI00146 [[Torrubiella] hemipterigena]